MIDVDEVLAWLRAGGEFEASEVLGQCAMEILYFDTAYQGEREYDLIDVQIRAPRTLLDRNRDGTFAPAQQVEAAIKDIAWSHSIIVHRFDWVAEPSFSSIQPSAPEHMSEALSQVDSFHVQWAWQKSLVRMESDPDGAITAAKALLESVCKFILEKETGAYPRDADLPTLYNLVAGRLELAPNQHTDKLVKTILGNAQAVVGGVAALRNQLGDAHGKGSQDWGATAPFAMLAVNLSGAVSSCLVTVWELRQKA